MVRTINVPLDDDVFERASEVKDALGLSWAEYIEEATVVLDPESEEGLERDNG